MKKFKKVIAAIVMLGMLLIPVSSVMADETKTVTLTHTVSGNGITYANQTWSFTPGTQQTKTLNAATNANGTVTYSLQSQKNSGGTTVSYFTFDGNASTRVLTASADTLPGTYTVVVRAYAAGDTSHIAGYKDSTITVTVAKLNPTVSAPTAKSGLVYNGSAQTLVNAGTTSGGTLYYGLGSSSSSAPSSWSTNLPSQTNAGTYYVWYKVTGNTSYNDVAATYACSVTISKANGSVVLSSGSGTITYPSSTTFTVNTNTSGGTLSVSSNASATATASISGTTVTVKPAAVTSDGGKATITVTSAATSNYNQASATYTVTVNRGTITLTPTALNGTYNGSPQYAKIKANVSGVTIVSGTSTSYGNTVKSNAEAGTDYNLLPGYTGYQASTTIYYKASMAGYKDATGSTTAAIARASAGSKPTTTSISKVYNGSSQNNGYTTPNNVTMTGNNSGTNAGTYTATYTPKANYAWSDGTTGEVTVTLTITNAAFTVSDPDQSYTYNGSAQGTGISVTDLKGSQSATIKYRTATSGDYNLTSAPTATNVSDSKTVYWQVTAPNHASQTGSYKLTITKANGSVTAPTAKTLTYNGSAQDLINAGSSTTGTINYKLGTGSYSTNIPQATNVGTYTVYYKVVGDSNHNDVAEKSLSVTINKRTINPSAPTLNSATLTYDGSAKTLANAGSSSAGGTMYYYVSTSATAPEFSTSTWKTSIDAKTEAGTYYVYWYCYVSDTANNNDTTTDDVNVVKSLGSKTINKASAGDKPANTTVSKVYNGSSQTNNYATPTNINMTGANSGTDVGTYTATYTPKANYAWSDGTTGSVSVTLTITNANISVTANDQSYTYDGSAHGNAISVTTVGSQTATIKYGTVEGTYNLTSAPKITNVSESKTIYYQVSAANHNTVTGSYKLTITKASGSVTAPTAKSGLVYNGSAQTLINAGSSSTGTIQYELEGAAYSIELPKATAAGTYTVYYRVIGDGNHNDVAERSITATISKRTVTPTAPTLNSATLTYDGNAKTLASAGSATAGGTMYYYVSTSATAPEFSTSSWKTSIDTKIDAGTYYVYWYCYVSDTANNNDTASDNINVVKSLGSKTINKASNPLTYANQTWNYTFSTASQSKTLAQASGNQGALTYALQSQPSGNYFSFDAATLTLTAAANTPAGTHEVVIRATAAGNSNYLEGYKDSTVTVTIAKAENTITFETPQSGSFIFTTGTRSESFNAAGNAQGAITYSITSQKRGDSTVDYFSIPTASVSAFEAKASTPAGEYTLIIRATAAGNGNYNSGYREMTYSLTIEKAPNTMSFVSSQIWNPVYSTGGQSTSLTGASNAQGTLTYALISQAGGSHFTLSGTELTMAGSTPAGTYTLTVKASAAGNSNYLPSELESIVTVTVAKAANPINVTSSQSGDLTYSTGVQNKAFSGASQAQGSVSYSVTAKDSNGGNVSYFTIPNTAKPSFAVEGSTPVDTYTLTITATAAGNDNYLSGYRTITYTLAINKASNPITVNTNQNWSDANYNIADTSKVLTPASNAQGTVTYNLESQTNASNGNVDYFSLSGHTLGLKKLTPAGTYTVVIRATAAGNSNYLEGYKDITVSVKVSEYKLSMIKGTGITSVSYKLGDATAVVFTNAITVPVGQTVKYSAELKKDSNGVEGYSWKNWSGTHSSTTKEYSYTMPAGNVTDTANAVANDYTYDVVYKSSTGRTLGTTTITKKFDTNNSITAPSRTGYNTPETQVVAWDSTVKKTITFTYPIITYTITYNNMEGATNHTSNPDTYNIEDADIVFQNPFKIDHEFQGWYSNSSLTSEITQIDAGSHGDKSIYAKWEETAYEFSGSVFRHGEDEGMQSVVASSYYSDSYTHYYRPASDTCTE